MARHANQIETLNQQTQPTQPPSKPIYDYQCLNPDDSEMRIHPYNGETVMVSDDPDKSGCVALWRTTRCREKSRWVKTGLWVTPLLNSPLPFRPLYWRKFYNLEHL